MILALRLVSLTVIYALALASFAPADLATGLVLSAGCLVAVRGLHSAEDAPAGDIARRLAFFPVLFAAVTGQVARGVSTMSLIVLGLRSLRRPGLVEVPMGGRSESGMAAAAVLTTLAPGDVVLDVDLERQTMLIHTIDAS
ncbi:MAG TPA: Na+/H+ antiporter subunit E, partial [Solirubrobacteraceae bacterium]|nr:Na+/H+ antiporter subunit E [Solirubrobacteraceae bacterium]